MVLTDPFYDAFTFRLLKLGHLSRSNIQFKGIKAPSLVVSTLSSVPGSSPAARYVQR